MTRAPAFSPALAGHGDLAPLERLVADAIARARHYHDLAEVDTVADGEPDEIRAEARAVAAALESDRASASRLAGELLILCADAERFQGRRAAWVPTAAVRRLLDEQAPEPNPPAMPVDLDAVDVVLAAGRPDPGRVLAAAQALRGELSRVEGLRAELGIEVTLLGDQAHQAGEDLDAIRALLDAFDPATADPNALRDQLYEVLGTT